MADEKRIVTFEWLNQNLGVCKKESPLNSKKGVTKNELITNYNVNIDLLIDRDNKNLVPREVCLCRRGF